MFLFQKNVDVTRQLFQFIKTRSEIHARILMYEVNHLNRIYMIHELPGRRGIMAHCYVEPTPSITVILQRVHSISKLKVV
jgi:hypothetical protein